MTVLQFSISPRSESFAANRTTHEAAIKPVREAAALAVAGGGDTARERHYGSGRILPCERVSRLLDPDSPFLEIDTFVAHGLQVGTSLSAGVVAGIGRVSGHEVMIVCNDATVKGGTYFPTTANRLLRAQEIAEHQRVP